MGGFWGLGAIYALGVTNDPNFVRCLSPPTSSVALAQYPIGMASDRIDEALCTGRTVLPAVYLPLAY